MPDTAAQLRERLTVEGGPPAVLDRLDAAQAGRLLELVDRASERQRQGLEASMDAVLAHAPRMLRGRLHKVLFGEASS